MRTLLSYGMDVESSAILVQWIKDASVRPCAFSKLILITSQTGDEYDHTRRDVELYIVWNRGNWQVFPLARHRRAPSVSVLPGRWLHHFVWRVDHFPIADHLES